MQPRLRLFNDTPIDGPVPDEGPKVSITLGDLVGVISDASDADRAWLADFHDEDVDVSEDLYEVIAMYRRMKKAA